MWRTMTSSLCLFGFLLVPHLSQRCSGTEGVGGEAQAAAAGVCTQGEHPSHATRHQGAGNARVHSMCLFTIVLVVVWFL